MNQQYNIQLSCDIVAKGRPPPSGEKEREKEKERERESVAESDKENDAERGYERGNESENGSQRMQITAPKYCYNIEIVESSVGGEEGTNGGQGNSNVRT